MVDPSYLNFIQKAHYFNHMDVKYGDIVFLSFEVIKPDSKKSGLVFGEELSGSLVKWNYQNKQGEKNQEQYLFKIVENQSNPQKKEEKLNLQDIITERRIHQKEFEVEQYDEENKKFVLFGQSLLLYHVYSGCYLTFKIQSMNVEQNSIRVDLNSKISEHSLLKFQPVTYNFKNGQKIKYSDLTFITSSIDRNLFIKINTNKQSQIIEGSHIKFQFKLNYFQEEFEKKQQDNFVRIGDIIRIKEVESGYYLSLRCLHQKYEEKNHEAIMINKDLKRHKFTFPEYEFHGHQINSYEVVLAKENPYLQLWEVCDFGQNNFMTNLKSKDSVLLRNVVTGLYLRKKGDEVFLSDSLEKAVKLRMLISANHKVIQKLSYLSEISMVEDSQSSKSFLIKQTERQDKKGKWVYQDRLFQNRNILENSLGVFNKVQFCQSSLNYFQFERQTSSDFMIKKIKGTIKSLQSFYYFLLNWGKIDNLFSYVEMMGNLKSIKQEYVQYEQIIQELMNLLMDLEFQFQKQQKQFFIENLEANGAVKILIAMIRFIKARIFPRNEKQERGFNQFYVDMTEEQPFRENQSEENKESYDCQFVGRFLMKNIIQNNLMILSQCIENEYVQEVFFQFIEDFIFLDIEFHKEFVLIIKQIQNPKIFKIVEKYDSILDSINKSISLGCSFYMQKATRIYENLHYLLKTAIKIEDFQTIKKCKTLLGNQLFVCQLVTGQSLSIVMKAIGNRSINLELQEQSNKSTKQQLSVQLKEIVNVNQEVLRRFLRVNCKIALTQLLVSNTIEADLPDLELLLKDEKLTLDWQSSKFLLNKVFSFFKGKLNDLEHFLTKYFHIFPSESPTQLPDIFGYLNTDVHSYKNEVKVAKQILQIYKKIFLNMRFEQEKDEESDLKSYCGIQRIIIEGLKYGLFQLQDVKMIYQKVLSTIDSNLPEQQNPQENLDSQNQPKKLPMRSVESFGVQKVSTSQMMKYQAIKNNTTEILKQVLFTQIIQQFHEINIQLIISHQDPLKFNLNLQKMSNVSILKKLEPQGKKSNAKQVTPAPLRNPQKENANTFIDVSVLEENFMKKIQVPKVLTNKIKQFWDKNTHFRKCHIYIKILSKIRSQQDLALTTFELFYSFRKQLFIHLQKSFFIDSFMRDHLGAIEDIRKKVLLLKDFQNNIKIKGFKAVAGNLKTEIRVLSDITDFFKQYQQDIISFRYFQNYLTAFQILKILIEIFQMFEKKRVILKNEENLGYSQPLDAQELGHMKRFMDASFKVIYFMTLNNPDNFMIMQQNLSILIHLLYEGFRTEKIIAEIVSNLDHMNVTRFFEFLLNLLDTHFDEVKKFLTIQSLEKTNEASQCLSLSQKKSITFFCKGNEIMTSICSKIQGIHINQIKNMILMKYLRDKLLEHFFDITNNDEIIKMVLYINSYQDSHQDQFNNPFKEEQDRLLFIRTIQSMISLVVELINGNKDDKKLFLQIFNHDKLIHIYDVQKVCFKRKVLQILKITFLQDLGENGFPQISEIKRILKIVLKDIQQISIGLQKQKPELQENSKASPEININQMSEIERYLLNLNSDCLEGLLPFTCHLFQYIQKTSQQQNREFMGSFLKILDHFQKINLIIQSREKSNYWIQYQFYFRTLVEYMIFLNNLEKKQNDQEKQTQVQQEYQEQADSRTEVRRSLKINPETNPQGEEMTNLKNQLIFKMIEKNISFEKLISSQLFKGVLDCDKKLNNFIEYLGLSLESREGNFLKLIEGEQSLKLLRIAYKLEQLLFQKNYYFIAYHFYQKNKGLWSEVLNKENKIKILISMASKDKLNIDMFQQDISRIRQKFKSQYIEINQNKKKPLDLLIFTQNSQSVNIIIIIIISILENNNQLKKLKYYQNKFLELQVPLKLIEILCCVDNNVTRNLIIKALIFLLHNANKDIQECLFKILSGGKHQNVIKKLQDNFLQLQYAVLKKFNNETAQLKQFEELFMEKFMVANEVTSFVFILKLIQNLCENCFIDFQLYLTSLQQNSYCNFLQLTIDFYIEFSKIILGKKNHENTDDILAILNQTYSTLEDFLLGPCEQNITFLISHEEFQKFLTKIMNYSYEDLILSQSHVKIFCYTIKLFKIMTLTKKETLCDLMEKIDIQILFKQFDQIYQKSFEYNKENFELDRLCKKNSENSIFFTISSCEECSYPLCQNELVSQLDQDLFEYTFSSYSILHRLEKIQKQELMTEEQRKMIEYFDDLEDYVEICYNDKIFQIDFKKPFFCIYADKKVLAQEILEKTCKCQTFDEKIEKFVTLIPVYKNQMIQNQQYSKLRVIKALTQNEIKIYYVRFSLILLLNIFIIINIKFRGEDQTQSPQELEKFQSVFSFITQEKWVLAVYSFLSILVYFFILVEICVKSLNRQALRKAKQTVTESTSENEVYNHVGVRQKNSLWSKMKEAITDYSIISYVLLIISALAFAIPFLWGVVLLDVISKNREMIDIINSITVNYQQLLKTLYLAMIIMYFYAFLSFTYFPTSYLHGEDSDYKMYCYSLASCYISSIYNGIRSGGIGKAIGSIGLSDKNYWLRVFYDLTYFILVIVCLLNIVFGIIIDTFADLRDKRKEIENIKNTTCYICEKERYEIESQGHNFQDHYTKQHNVVSYLCYLITITQKAETDCDGLEKYVKNQIRNKQHAFLPNRSNN